MADAETVGKFVIPGRLARLDGALQGQGVAPAEGLKNVPDEAVRCLPWRVHCGNPSLRIVSPASGRCM